MTNRRKREDLDEASTEPVFEPVKQGKGTPQARGTHRPAPKGPAATDEDLERLLGGTLLSRVGILILVLGFGFFVKLAIDRGWIGPVGQISLAVAGGVALIVAGGFLEHRGRYGYYPQVLAGGGFAVVYLSLFAAYAFETYREALGLLVEVDIALLVFTSLALGIYAAARDLPVLAVQAAFLTAVTGFLPGPELAWLRMGQLVLLTVGIAGAAIVRRWATVVLAVETVVYTTIFLLLAIGLEPIHALWGLGALWLAFAATGWREPADARFANLLSVNQALAVLATWALGMFALALGGWSEFNGWFTLGVAVVALAMALPAGPTASRLGWAAGGVAAAVAWPPIHFDGPATSAAWLGLLAAAIVAEYARSNWATRVGVWGLAAAASLHLLILEVPEVHDGGLGLLVASMLFFGAGALMLVAWAVERRDPVHQAPGMILALGAATLPAVYVAIGFEGFWVTVAWALQALVFVAAGFALSGREVRYLGLGLFTLAVLRIFIVDLAGLDVVFRVVALMVVGVALLLASMLYNRLLGTDSEKKAGT